MVLPTSLEELTKARCKGWSLRHRIYQVASSPANPLGMVIAIAKALKPHCTSGLEAA
jgi:hypothetical protein